MVFLFRCSLGVMKNLCGYTYYRCIQVVIITKVVTYKISDNEEFSSITYLKIITPILSNVIHIFIGVACIIIFVGFVQQVYNYFSVGVSSNCCSNTSNLLSFASIAIVIRINHKHNNRHDSNPTTLNIFTIPIPIPYQANPITSLVARKPSHL